MNNENTQEASLPIEQLDQPKLTQAEIIAAATNSSSLADTSFEYGGRTFKLLHLEYDSYLEFMAFLQPLLEGIAGKFAASQGINLPGLSVPDLSAEVATASLMKFCKKDLPAMACIVCNQQALHEKDESLAVTAAWVKKHAKTPFELVSIVLKQVNKNQMIKDFSDFFVQMLPMVGMVMQMTKSKTARTA